MSRGLILAVACLAFLVGLAAWGAQAAWRLAGDAPMSVHGWVAMAIAGVGVAGLTGALISLAFYSARKGYDDDHPPGPP